MDRWRTTVALVCLMGFHATAMACDLEAMSGTGSCGPQWMDEQLRMNDVQAIGTHNSYKLALPAEEMAAHRAHDRAGAESIDYHHPPLAMQLDRGLRSLELDVYRDPQGGRFLQPPGAHRGGYRVPPWPPSDRRQMQQPGFKVMHLPDIDFRSSCATFRGCLTILRDWSLAHPRHVPILVTINAKDGRSGPGAVAPLPFDAAAFDALDAEVREVFSRDDLIVPDQVQGGFATLREAVRAGQWPTLATSRGKVLFALDEDARKVALYRGARRSLEGRVMFVNTDESSPAAAYLTLNDPVAERARIARAVADGYLVRTRADADTVEARRNDPRRRQAAFESGAQYISTDYPQADRRFSGYRVGFPGGEYLRCNPSRPVCRRLPVREGADADALP